MTSTSQASRAVDTWKGDLISKKRPKFVASVAHPDVNPELFEEGWEQTLSSKSVSTSDNLKVIDSLTSRGEFADKVKAAVGRGGWRVGGCFLIFRSFFPVAVGCDILYCSSMWGQVQPWSVERMVVNL
jgi:hypothetical protein